VQGTGRAAERLLARARRLAAKEGVTATTKQSYGDDTALAIVAAAGKARASLIVMASHGRKGLGKMLLGSETQKVLTRSKTPVLVVH
jgi:nucleotide-binding universal stress UspA family protein